MTDRDRASGHPEWEAPQGRGLPVVPQPAPEAPPAAAPRTVAGWLGWSPTSWRSARSWR